MIEVLGLMTCYNRKEKTINAISKLVGGNRDIHFEFIVVDDGSTDGTIDELMKISNIEIITGNGNLYYSGGMRKAITEAKKKNRKFDYILLFNDDVDFFSNAIEKLASREKGVIWVGPTCDFEGNLSYGGVKKASKWRPKVKIVKACEEEGMECDTFNANCVLIPYDIFMDLNNIDTIYTHSMGDFDYGFAAKRKGYIIKVSNEFVGICCDNAKEGSWLDATLSRRERFRLKESPKGLPQKEWFHYLKKNYSILVAILYWNINVMKICFRL